MTPRIWASLLTVLLILAAGDVRAAGEPFETKARQAFMIDAETGTILFAKDADQPVPPAALAKLMTMEVVFHALKSGRLSLDETFTVSENAWRTGGAPSGGSTMFAELKSSIRLEDLIQGVVVQSANDGCIIIAEGMAGSEAKFAEMMNERARAIGLTRSTFRNSSGLPSEGQVVTIRELVMLGEHIWREYPEFYRYYAQPDFTWNKIKQRNRNPLLSLGIGVDGMGTGFTEESGYAMLASMQRDGHRIFAAVGGLASEKERAEEARKMLEWSMNGFTRLDVFAAGEMVGEAAVFGGAKSGVALRAKGPISIFIPVGSTEKLAARIVYEGPVVAPVAAGTRVGSLKVWVGDAMSQETPLYTAEEVGLGSLVQRAVDAAGELLLGWAR